ncbi:MAG: hypothetical protein G01um101416_920 [Microgenomates group bacterium Gr01-1014_16]|nr:MAG: hypothetical protein G01um101416_920 [Microgenomates group bacterium Gr01-1014_16]
MAKSALRLEAIRLRKQGKSVRDIAKKIGVAKSSASLWVRDIILTLDQAEKLNSNSVKGRLRGGLKGALIQKQARMKREVLARKLEQEEFPHLTNREIRIAGLCLYWAEGTKKSRSIVFCNSDPDMIIFFIKWLKTTFNISQVELKCAVGINEAHKQRETKVKNYWSSLTDIPLVNFTKTSFKKYPLRKIYENFNNHYGTLALKLSRPGRIYNRVMGEIYGLTQAINSPIMPG